MQQWYHAPAGWYRRSLGGSLTGDPTASVGTTVPFLFGRGSDDTLFQWYFSNGAWYSRTLGGSLAGIRRWPAHSTRPPYRRAQGYGRRAAPHPRPDLRRR
jgi:hypothetical protein